MDVDPRTAASRMCEGGLLVLGAGIAGLAAADEALAQGEPVVVVEKEAAPGGLLRTDRRDGFSFDRGGHRFLTAIPWVLERVQELLGERLLLRTRKSFVFLDGKRIDYPLRLGSLLRELGPVANARALLSFLTMRVTRRPSVENLEEWLRTRFGDYLYRRVFEGYTEKLWGVPPRDLSAEWAPQRITIPSLGGFLREMVLPSRIEPRTYARTYLYPRRGIGEIPEALSARVQRRGGTILLASRVTSLRREKGRWTAHIETGDRSLVLREMCVVSTIPLPALLSLVEKESRPPLPRLPTRGLCFLNLGFDLRVPVDATWIYQPDPALPLTRVQIPAARSPEMVPVGCGSLQLEIPFAGNGTVAAAVSEERVAEASGWLRRMGLDLPAPVLAFETRERDAYPVYREGAAREARAALEWIRGLPGLHSVGRQGEFSYCFLDRALAAGVNAARELLGLEPHPVAESSKTLPLEASSLSGVAS